MVGISDSEVYEVYHPAQVSHYRDQYSNNPLEGEFAVALKDLKYKVIDPESQL
jgi:hypothetical protein